MKRAVVGILSLLSTYPSCTAAYTATLRAPSVAFSLHLAGARLGLRLQMQGPILDASRSMNPERPEGAKRFAPAAQRNTPPILAVLKDMLPVKGRVLAIAEGSGQHVSAFASTFPALEYLPTDLEAECRASIAAYVEEAGLSNVVAPVVCDCTKPDYAALGKTPFDFIYVINMSHIAPWAATLGLLEIAARVLNTGGMLFIYGPFKVKGQFTTDSNRAFDQSLRSQNQEWGYRDIGDVEEAAKSHRLELTRTLDMPANNHVLLFTKQ